MQARILGPFQLEEGRHIPVGDLVGGEVTYQPEPLEQPGPGHVLLCCSQPRTNLWPGRCPALLLAHLRYH
jgi:hypothetical protein